MTYQHIFPLSEQFLPCYAGHGLAGVSCNRLTFMVAMSVLLDGMHPQDHCAQMHVAYRESMCRCTLGTPAGISQQAGELQRNAKLTYQMWPNQGQHFMPREQPPMDIALPALLRKTVSEPTVMPLPPGKLLAHCSNLQARLPDPFLSRYMWLPRGDFVCTTCIVSSRVHAHPMQTSWTTREQACIAGAANSCHARSIGCRHCCVRSRSFTQSAPECACTQPRARMASRRRRQPTGAVQG